MSNKRIAIALEIDLPYPQHQGVFGGVQRYAAEHPGWQCLIDEHPMYRPRQRGADYGTYDGVIARATAPMQRRLKHHGIPLVNTLYQTARPGLPGVYPDADRLGHAAADHLLDRGFQNLCYLGEIKLHRHSAEVGRAFRDRAQEQGGQCVLFRIRDDGFKAPAFWLALERLLDDAIAQWTPPVGVFVEEAPVARMVVQRCEAKGLDVPRDVAVLSQHNLKSVVDVSPQISSIQINNDLAGYEAARLLDRLMSGEVLDKPERYIPPQGVVGRETTDFFAVQDPLVAEALRHIAAHLREPMRVDDIAYALSVSPRLLQMRFDRALGRGVSEEVRRLRLALAKRLLADKARPIGEIAEQAGFKRPQQLNAVFQRELGMTPSAYRQQAIGEREG